MTPRVAFVATSTEFAGAERYLVLLARHLAGRYDLAAVLPQRAVEPAEALADAGVRIVGVEGLARRPSLRGVRGVRAALAELEPGVVHVNVTDQGDGLAPIAASRGRWRSTVVTLQNWIPDRARWRERISVAAVSRPRARIAISDSVARSLAVRGLDAVTVRHGIDPPAPAADPRGELGIEPGALVVGGIGRLHEQKGWDVLAEASRLVRERVPSVQVVVIGEGPLGPTLESSAPEGVRYVGYRADAAAHLGAFDVLAMPSRYEGFGLVAAEAMLAGVPVVASAVDALPEVVGDAGVLVPPDRPGELATAILALIEDRGRRETLVERGRARAAALFSADRMAAETAAVYDSLL